MFKAYWENGRIQTISFFHKNKKNSLWRGYFDDGKNFFERGFDDDKSDGVYKVFYINGQLKEDGHYSHNRKVGTWKYYNEKGDLIKTENFE